jgi:LiaI-LiaF-like transmembrane region
MRRGELFWGILLVVLGGLFALKQAGYLAGDVFSWFWPVFIIAAGVWVVLGTGSRSQPRPSQENLSIPLQGAKTASLRIDSGVGRISLGAGAKGGDFVTGVQAPGMNHTEGLNGDHLEVSIEAGPSVFPFLGPEGGVWQYSLDARTPTTIAIHSGATRLDVDLKDLNVTRFSFQGGASSLNLTLPATVESMAADIEAGAAGIELRVPDGVALRLRAKTVGSVIVDEGRFPRRDLDLYESPDYDVAARRADVSVEGGATSLRVV